MLKLSPLRAFVFVSLLALASFVKAETTQIEREVDIVIALDVSRSMEGLIDSTKQRLWDIVNDLGRAQPVPVLRVAIVSFGDPRYGADSGFVRVDQQFTRDLDAVNEALFAFRTNGGEEYVARAVDTAVRSLQWSTADDALRILFVAGNESALQDLQIGIERAARMAIDKGVVVNTIYCGSDQDEIAGEWRRVAELTNGIYASIDQHAAAVSNVATPMDDELARLNEALNETYIPFGSQGPEFQANQAAQDRNAAGMSRAALASRAFTKTTSLYSNSSWDLVDALAAGTRIEDVAVDDLPEVMRPMDMDARRDHVSEHAGRREALSQEIAALDAERRDYIAELRRSEPAAAGGLDDALREALRLQARDKGLELGHD